MVAVCFEDVGMVAEHVDFYLIDQKFQLQLCFFECFDSSHQTDLVAHCLDDFAGLTFGD